MSNKLDRFKNTLIYESQKEFYDERGKGARYRMTTVGVSFFKEELGDLKDMAALVAWLQDNHFAEKIEMTEDNLSVELKVKGCCLHSITDGFRKMNRQPLSCPIANVIMASMELNGSMPPEILPIEFEGDVCKVKMAKIFTSAVVE
ncbi:MAG: hypothetical protein GX167_08565 [Firmicutes bacterium]|jgi:hypothetical protein|nr:hypothetical protein [Bacillota bacterium]